MEKVTLGDDLPGYVCGDPTHPGVVVVQEWWGVTETIQAHALRISKEGYRVLVPDLYKGALGVNVEEAHHLMSNLDWDVATGTTRRDEHARDRGDRGTRDERLEASRDETRPCATTKLTTRHSVKTSGDPSQKKPFCVQSRCPRRCPTCALPDQKQWASSASAWAVLYR